MFLIPPWYRAAKRPARDDSDLWNTQCPAAGAGAPAERISVRVPARGGWRLCASVLLVLLAVAGVEAAVPTGTDREALEALYDATNGANWKTSTNWKTTDGDWYGVTTDTNGAVTELRLPNNNLVGTIPAALGDLTNLTKLHLHSNGLIGTIPTELGQLTNLTELLLHNNRDERYPNGVLNGPLPTSFTALTSLTEVHLQNSQLTVPTGLTTGRTVTTGTATSSGTIPLATANTDPTGVWATFSTLYVADPSADKVFAYTRADGTHDATKDITLAAANTDPAGVWARTATLYVADPSADKVFAYSRADGTHDAAKDITLATANTAARGLWSDFTTIWVADASGKVYAYTLSDGMPDTTKDFNLAAANGDPWGLWADRSFTSLPGWVVDAEDLRLYAYRLDNGSHRATRYRVLDPANTAPRGIARQGDDTWYVADAEDAVLYVYGPNITVLSGDTSSSAGQNRSPEAVGTLPDMTLAKDDIVLIDPRVAFRDPDGDGLTYTASGSDPPASVFMHRTSLQVWIWAENVGTSTGTVTATDPSGRSATQEFTVTVVAGPLANQGPLAVGALPDVELALEGSVYQVAITMEFVDPNDEDMNGLGSGHRLTYGAASSNAAVATVSVREIPGDNIPEFGAKRAEVSVVPVGVGTTTVTVTATDASGSNTTATQPFTVTVQRVSSSVDNTTPTAAAGTVTTPVDTAYTFRAADFNFMDPDPGAALASVTIVTLPAQGSLDLNTVPVSATDVVPATALAAGQLTYTPPAGQSGTNFTSFTFTVNDGTAESTAPTTMTIHIPSGGPTTGGTGGGGTGGGGGGSSGGGGGSVITEEEPAPIGFLENPGPAAFQSGLGVISGWVCEAEAVEIELNGVAQAAAYGTERLDTEPVCGDTDNGFGLLFNWNLLGDGAHEVVAYVDDIELDRATVTVTTLGEEFLRDVTGTCEVADFPTLDETVSLVWQQGSQNFVLVAGERPQGSNRAGIAGVGVLENPGPDSFQSGIGVLSGWVCEADAVEIELGTLGRQPAAYGTERLDTESVCGDTDNGFGLLFNWNLLGDGEHAVVAYVDGEELGRATVRVTTLGEEFVQGVAGECVVEDFPAVGQTATLAWQQPSQNFVIVDVQ